MVPTTSRAPSAPGRRSCGATWSSPTRCVRAARARRRPAARGRRRAGPAAGRARRRGRSPRAAPRRTRRADARSVGEGRVTRVAAGVAHRHRDRVPAEMVAEPRDGRRARVAGQGEGGGPRRIREAAADHDHGGVGGRCGALEAVLGEEHGRTQIGVQPRDRGEHVLRALWVELAGGLVEHEHLGRGDERTRDRAPLPLAARELGRVAVAQVRDAERVEHLLHPPPHRDRVDPEVLQPERDVGLDPVDHELRLGVLVHEADDVGEQAGCVIARRPSGDHDLTGEASSRGVRHQPVGGPQQRALAATGGADHEQDVAGRDGEVDVIEGVRTVGVPERDVAVVERPAHALPLSALRAGPTTALGEPLDPDLLIFESGGSRSRGYPEVVDASALGARAVTAASARRAGAGPAGRGAGAARAQPGDRTAASAVGSRTMRASRCPRWRSTPSAIGAIAAAATSNQSGAVMRRRR